MLETEIAMPSVLLATLKRFAPLCTVLLLATTVEVDGQACTLDLLVCPDGTGVGRVPPNCAFAPCPQLPLPPPPPTTAFPTVTAGSMSPSTSPSTLRTSLPTTAPSPMVVPTDAPTATPVITTSAPVRVTMVPTNVPPPPSLRPTSRDQFVRVVSTAAGEDLELGVPNPNVVSVNVIEFPRNGSLRVDTNLSITYTPNARFVGLDLFSVEYCTAMNAECNVTTFEVQVIASGASPTSGSGGSSSSSSSSSNTALYGLAGLVVLPILLLVVGVALWRKKRKQQQQKAHHRPPDPLATTPDSGEGQQQQRSGPTTNMSTIVRTGNRNDNDPARTVSAYATPVYPLEFKDQCRPVVRPGKKEDEPNGGVAPLVAAIPATKRHDP